MTSSSTIRFAIAQINPIVGNIAYNTKKIIDFATKAAQVLHADVVVFPELTLIGYPPEDLLLRSELYDRINAAFDELKKSLPTQIYVIIGYPENINSQTFNSAAILHNGKIIANCRKQILPNYGVFDEKRYFQQGMESCIFEIKKQKIGLLICEDLWQPEPIAKAKQDGAKCIISINASPFDFNKPLLREKIVSQRATEAKVPIIYANTVGGQDELVFDGGSFIMNATGEKTQCYPFFQEALNVAEIRNAKDIHQSQTESRGITLIDSSSLDFPRGRSGKEQSMLCFAERQSQGDFGCFSHEAGKARMQTAPAMSKRSLLDINEHCEQGRNKAENQNAKSICPIPPKIELIYQALVLGIRDYVEKNKFPGILIGLSGGIDSALTLALAVDAIGKDRVKTVYMPSRYSRSISGEDAKLIAKNFGVKYSEISIEPVFQSFLNTLQEEFANTQPDLTEENLQARCRGTILMAISNKEHLLVVSTGNKSEMAVGYSTLYGDMVGGFCALKDVPKTLVYELTNYRNKIGSTPLIPERIIDRPPSAELAPNQEDTNSLPPYPILDAILERFVELDQSEKEIVAAGFDAAIVKKVVNLVYKSEYKRRQAPIGVRITQRAFGKDRRYPITSYF